MVSIRTMIDTIMSEEISRGEMVIVCQVRQSIVIRALQRSIVVTYYLLLLV